VQIGTCSLVPGKMVLIAKNADLHISTTEHLRNQIITILGARSEDIQTVHGGVSEEALLEKDTRVLREKLELPVDQTLVGYIGLFRTLRMEKGIITMIEALTYVPREKNIKMVFVGGKGEEIDFYQKKAKELNVEEQCIFIEKVSSDLVMDYQSAMDILVIPYPDLPHYRNYGFPMKTYEYMASGVPIVYSNLPIIEEVLRDYGTSFVAGNAQSLARVVIESMGTDQVIEKAKKAKQKSRGYTWEEKAKTILKYMETYEK
jgi:glycosyltransferase involved in cell wall biosynthesis